ncbi:MAG: 30S ribosomal protein S4 [Pseudomonadota bacterium]|uniref:30S ribosomal subunit protein S4 n=1 Tax=anaerobic digester metagenome TaxID=1263854 RepID=A0A485M204_9ZZZZ|nr:30S ribosomal protein S4 [Pseudomonadota bacterium]HPD22294.1 30S ribosomal protein S4 [Deltaproteobacteria bacterium]HPX19305.1 30S ribosomal protein S4 [Deltaproteobacteria bacterium]HRS57265.1 30S ribosomal protein S4 [Desulfomonilia bacterium]HRV36678.1 30S ribosomal protein S4 [Desulfomonilia bacterium]
MARYTGPVCKVCRREGGKLFLKGQRCYTDKCAVVTRENPPGQHGQGRIRTSEYRIHLREKQKVRSTYGLSESQFKRYYEMARSQRGATGENLLVLLERRLDNIIYRSGFTTSRAEARQLIDHGHFRVNGRKTDIPSYLVKEGDVIEVKEKSKTLHAIVEALEVREQRGSVEWIEVDADARKATVKALPERTDLPMAVEERLIVEFYSK